jgi:hypothetical protein
MNLNTITLALVGKANKRVRANGLLLGSENRSWAEPPWLARKLKNPKEMEVFPTYSPN